MRRRQRQHYPVDKRPYFLTLKTGKGYVDLVLNGNFLLIGLKGRDEGKMYRLSDEGRQRIHDGQGWSLYFLLWIIENIN